MNSILFILTSFQEYLPLIIALGILVVPTFILLFIVVGRLLIKHIKRTRKPKQTKEDVKNKYLVPFGENNIVSLSVEMTRVKIEVSDLSKVDLDGLRALGVGILISGNTVKCSSKEFAESIEQK
jgi:hypothetical protein